MQLLFEAGLKYFVKKNQLNLIEKYIGHYQTGSNDTQKDSQRFWVKY
jgi:hypothetical protein